MTSYRKIVFIIVLLFFALTANSTDYVWAGKKFGKWNETTSWLNKETRNQATSIPTLNDNVFFSEGLSNVIIEGEFEFQDLLIGKNAKVKFYSIGKSQFQVYGSLIAESKIEFQGTIDWNFRSIRKSILKSSGTIFSGDLIFTNYSIITIQDDIQTLTDFIPGNSKLFFQGKYLVCREFNLSSHPDLKFENDKHHILADNVYGNRSLLNKKNIEIITKSKSSDGENKTLCAATVPFTITASATTNYNGFDVSCNGGTDATICVTVTGGVGPFNFQWVSGPATACFSGVDAGNYIVVVFDMGQGGVSCFTTVVVDEPTEMTLLSWTGTNPSCFGACDGTANPIIVGGVPPYNYSWSTGETTPVADELCNGLNTVNVTDANGCVFDTSFFILIPTQVEPNLSSQVVSCNGLCDGEAYSAPTGGNGAPYTFDWSTGSVNDTITGLCAGTYFIEVADNSGCLGFDTITVTQPVSMVVNVVSITHLVCNGVCSGSITISSSNGTLPHSYQWFNATTGLPIAGATLPVISGLCAGDYFVVVTDAAGCVFTSNDITITQPPAITITITGTDLICNNVCTGILDATTSGGTGTIDVTWFNAFTGLPIGVGDPLNNVCAGTYFAQGVDDNGCIVNSLTETITQPPSLNISVTDVDLLCFGDCNGTATAVLSGGTGGLTVEWFTSPGNVSQGSVNPITSLCAGDYYGVIEDANGCTLNSDTFNIDEPLELDIVSQSNTDVQCNGACDGTATFNVTGGTGSITVQWFQNPGAVPVGVPGATINGLCPGTYFAIATDANGCTIQSSNQNITQPTALDVTVTSTSSECGSACTGSAEATITGGNSPYTLNWVNATTGVSLVSTANPISGLCAGDYYLVVTDDNGCVDTSALFTITSTVIVDGTIIANDIDCNGFCNGLADLSPFGGVAPYSFEWFDQVTGLPIGQSTEDANGLCAGDYFVVITDVDLCNSVPIQVSIAEPLDIDVILTSTDVNCFGDCNGTITSVINGGTLPYTLNWINSTTGISTGQSGNTATNLCPDDYQLQITDGNGCVINSPIETIEEPAPLNTSVAVTDAGCFNTCNGTATITVVGGNSPYTVSWSTSANTNLTETSLCPGTGNYTVTDSAGCSSGPNNFIITSPTDATVTVANGTVDCEGDCDGTVSVNVSGGTSPYTYQWDAATGNQTNPIATNLCEGTYSVNVTDAAGCNYGPFNASVTEPVVLTLTTSVTDALCTGTCDGAASVTIVGGTAPYNITWNDPLTQNTSTAIQLCAGNYTVTVTDAEGCSQTANVTVNSTTSPSIVITGTDAGCNGVCDGTATAVLSGGTAPLSVSWNTGSTSNTISSLCAGTYIATVTDNNGCSSNASVTINEPTELTATFTTVSTACSVCNGSATVNPTGGTGSYTYQWSVSAASQTTQTATNLCAGIHTVDVTDGAGCTVTVLVALSNITSEIITLDSINATCNGLCNGSATVSFVCSDPVCSILWSDGQTTSTATGLCEGTYGVTVTNASGCVSAGTIDVNAPDILEANVVGTNVLCNGQCTGQAVASPTGGNSPYTYSWNDPALQTTFTAFNLCAGTYIVNVTDSIGCTGADTVVIVEPTAITLATTVNDVDCNGQCNGSATAFPSGGTTPYVYQWDDPASQTSQLATGLCAGNYSVTVLDANNCTVGPQVVNVNEPNSATITINATNVQCNGQCNGTATVSVVGGTAPYGFSWNDPLSQTSATASNLCAGTYTVTVVDANGCSLGSASVTISEPGNLSVSVTSTSLTCNGICDGQLSAVITGGSLPYTIQWNDPLLQSTSTAVGLCAGIYDLNVTDANGCQADATQSVSEPLSLNASLSVTDALCHNDCNGTAQVNPTGGTGSIDVLWSPGGQITTSVNSLCPGNYNVSITDDNGCSDNISFVINEPVELTLLTGSVPALCGVCDGIGSVSPSGGSLPYSIQWDAAAANQTTQVANNLCAGIYMVTVTDSGGCSISTAVPVSNQNGETVTVTPTPSTCPDVCNGSATASTACVSGPCSFEWFEVSTGNSLGITTNAISNVCPGDYIVQVINSLNCTTLVAVNIDAPDTIDVTESITEPLCSGDCNGSIAVVTTGGTGAITLSWSTGSSASTITNLCDGTYTLIVSDASGCDDTLTYSVNEPSPITITLNSVNAPCNAVCSGVATALVSGGSPGYTYLWNDGGAQTSPTAAGLCDGTYSVTVTDANGCSMVSTPVVITEPIPLSGIVSSVDPSCAGDCDGTGTVVISGGTSPFVIQWNDPSAQTTATANGLCDGTYEVVITDVNNCSDGPLSITLTEPVQVDATIVSTGLNCSGDCNGTITVNAFGGSGIYTYSINNGISFQASNSFTNLCAGTYDVIVMDNNNCTSSSISVNITEPTALDASTLSTNATCGVNDGAAGVFPFGGTPGYSIVWSDNLLVPIGQTTNTAINLDAGIYIATITDANGCFIQVSVPVSNTNAPLAANAIISPTCNGDCNGSIDVTVSGGTPGYTFEWSPSGQTTEDLNGLCAGTYIQEITDAAGCITFNSLNLNEPLPFAISTNVTDATCGLCDGSATVSASGGTGTLNLVWSNLQIGATANGLCAGAYSVLLTDANGCDEQFNLNVSNSTGPVAVVNVTNVPCSNVCSGAATVVPSGGTAPYSILWIETGETTATVNNLCAGTITVEVTDSIGCVAIANVNITSPTSLTDSIAVQPASCGVCDGTAVVFANGQLPITFQWNAAAGSATTQSVTSLCMGVYEVVVTDGNGCSDTISALLPNINAPEVSVVTTDISCNGSCDGTAIASPTGGNPPLTVNLMDAGGNILIPANTNFTNLCPGEYILQVTDALGCGSFEPFEITEPDSLVASFNFIQNESCFNTCDGIISAMPINGTLPFTYVWTNPVGLTASTATNLCDGIYSVTVTDANGCTITLNDTITEPTPIVMNLIPTDATCSSVPDGAIDATVTGGAGGFTYSWTGPGGFTANTEDLNAILFGTYVLTATDANGCSVTDSVFVNALIIAIANAGNDTTLCANLTGITLTGTGSPGSVFTWTDTLGNVLSNDSVLNVLPSGVSSIYVLMVDVSGCIGTDTVIVTFNPLPFADAGLDVEILSGQSATIGGSPTASSGNTILWQPEEEFIDVTASNPSVTPDSTTQFVVTVTDANGCTNDDTVMVTVYPTIIFPNGFSPNGDGANDTWILDFIEFFPESEVSVFNRWGQPVFYSKGYDIPWDGTYDGKPVTVGTYYYVILLNHELFPDAFTGPLTILR